MARAALEQLGLEKILWMPTGNPRYRDAPAAAGEHRVAMLRLALESEPRYEIDTRELSPGASGFTVDTLHELRLELGRDTTMFLLLGADQAEKLGAWHRPEEVKRLTRIVVFPRPGFGKKIDARRVDMAPMQVAGSDIRARVARGEDVSALVPAAVADYISQHGLYR
jgi:nicotinate-nucleotide adenylyltransferase